MKLTIKQLKKLDKIVNSCDYSDRWDQDFRVDECLEKVKKFIENLKD